MTVEPKEDERIPLDSSGESGPYEEIVEVFRSKPFLLELLDTEPGEKWLKNHTERRNADEFMETAVLNIQNVEATQEVARSGSFVAESPSRQTVNDEVRISLGYPKGHEITDDDRRQMTVASQSWWKFG